MGSLRSVWKFGRRSSKGPRGGLVVRGGSTWGTVAGRESARAWGGMSDLDRSIAADREDPSFDYAAH